MRLLLPIAAAVFCALLLACSGEANEPSATVEGTVTERTPALSSSSPGARATATPTATSASGIALFDVRTSGRTDLPISPQLRPEFGLGDSIMVYEGSTHRRFDFSGREIPLPVMASSHILECLQEPGGVSISGRMYVGVPTCGPIAPYPTGEWMLYSVPAPEVTGPGGRTFSSWDQWALNRHTDERRLLQAGLLHCGGCDGRFGPEWSPNGRFIYFAELISGGRTFLSDMLTGTTRLISQGSTESSSKPSWAGNDTLLYRSPSGAVVLENLGGGNRTQIADLNWPACFDSSGRFTYGPSGDGYGIYNITQQRIVATLQGTLETNGNGYPMSCPDPTPVQGQDDGVVAVLTKGPDCAGVGVYRDATRSACVDVPITVSETKDDLRDDARSVLSSNGGRVAIARITRVAPPHPCTQSPCTPPTIEALNRTTGSSRFRRLHTYEVLVVNAETGATKTLATGLTSPTPPELTWNSDGTHLLVRWPFETFSGP